MQAAGKSNVIAVINPDSGPDFTGRDATVKCLPHLKRAGNTLIGYVATGGSCTESSFRPPAALGNNDLMFAKQHLNIVA
jgi:hypothetical protein